MFDTYNSLEKIYLKSFTFIPTRYEIWMGGKMIDSGKTTSPIIAEVIEDNEMEMIEGQSNSPEAKMLRNIIAEANIEFNIKIMKVSFLDSTINHELAQYNMFDAFHTSNDRLQLITVPSETNSECIGLTMLRTFIGTTRIRKDFNKNEPYCCNIFTTNRLLSKITFSFSNPEKLVAFYSEPDIIQLMDLVIGVDQIENEAINYMEYGVDLCSQKLYDQAITNYNRAIELDPKLSEAYYNRGNTYYFQGFIDKAIIDFNKTIELNPKLAEAFCSRGTCYYNKELFDKAIQDYSKAIEINPHYDTAYYNRGNIYSFQCLYNNANSDYSAVIELNPQYAEAYLNRGNNYSAQGLNIEAKQDYNMAGFLFANQGRGIDALKAMQLADNLL